MALTRPTLIIRHSDSLLSSVVTCLKERSQPFEIAHSTADAISLLSRDTYRLLLCDWGVFSVCSQPQKELLIGKLLEHPAPLLLFSSLQEVSFRFRNLEGHPVYSYRVSALVDHFTDAVHLAEKAKQVDRQRPPSVPAPHFPTGLLIENPHFPTQLHLF